ncbi:GTPase [Candidatus Woesearchaeota archaeon]|nr:GTPase [Candidatus Woesearchaeota archaeon]
MKKIRVLIMGAAGTDFHTFNVFYRDNELYNVVGFTAEQIPDIQERKYPKELAGKLYPKGIPIYPEEKLFELIKNLDVDQVCFAYHDVSYDYLMHRAAIANSAGANFIMIGTKFKMLKSKKPVISVTAVRTGCGKSQTSRKIVDLLLKKKKKVVAIRHPMPYGNLVKQEIQRFADYNDLKKHDCTIEEMEEYEPYITRGMVVYAGVDYEKILRRAEKEADIILWDGGNNDYPFYETDLWITVMDPHRPGDELRYYAGEICFRSADVLIINKIDTADPEDVDIVRDNIRKYNNKARVIEAASPVTVDDPEIIKGKKVLVVEDGPTLTHGGTKFGAGVVAARKFGAKEIIDPRKFAAGKIKRTFERYPDIGKVLPAMGYGEEQIRDLQKTINDSDSELVIIGTPIDLGKIIDIEKLSVRVEYNLQEIGKPDLNEILEKFLETHNL